MVKVKVFNGGVKVEGKCYKGVEKGETGESSFNPLIKYNNCIVAVFPEEQKVYHDGEFICKLKEVPSKHFQYYMTAKN